MGKNELSAEDLRCECAPSAFSFRLTNEIEPLREVIGQERAVQAIRFGLNMKSPGYNIYITGIEGTGKTTITRDIVSEYARSLPSPSDLCMVNNFGDEYRPKVITLPSGRGARFARSIHTMIEAIRTGLLKEYESKGHVEHLKEIAVRYDLEKSQLMEQLDQSAKEKNLIIAKTQAGYQPTPLLNGKPMSGDQFEALPPAEKSAIETNIQAIGEQIVSTLTEIRKQKEQQQHDIEKLTRETALFVINERMERLFTDYGDNQDVTTYLTSVKEHISENVADFLQIPVENNSEVETAGDRPDLYFDPYGINVLVDHKLTRGAPVIFEPNPTYTNLFGNIEKRAIMGVLMTDFSMIQAGSLLRANGGYLILEIESVLMIPAVWEALKRALQNKLLYIEDFGDRAGMGTASLRPEPIPLEIKVILIGDYETFQLLQNHDSKFNKIFRVRADFDNETDLNETTLQQYAAFMARVCEEEALLPFTPEGVVAIVEYGKKHVAKKNKLSLRFGPIVGIIKEADFWARQEQANFITDLHVVRAFNEYRFRYNLYEEKIQESYTDNTIMVDVDGGEVGQVNALAVFQMGDISFGRPSRITAETFMGKHGIINIERESNLSGNTHNKGVLILSGYLGRTFAQTYPLCLSISLTFEQSYGGIDGDSASSTELYAILSSLANLPIQQGIAVTGSVNQKGKIQAIGGVNQKIEGFYDVCKSKGLTGKQGVLIPKANVQNLMLKREVVVAANEGQFHVYAVSTIEEGIEILTGVPAGTPDAQGLYPANTVYGRIHNKLKTYLERSLQFQKAMFA